MYRLCPYFVSAREHNNYYAMNLINYFEVLSMHDNLVMSCDHGLSVRLMQCCFLQEHHLSSSTVKLISNCHAGQPPGCT